MKNRLLLLAMVALPFFASAQDTPPATGIKLGISVGSNISFMRNDAPVNYDPWTGRVAGFTFELPLHKNFALNTGLYYEQRNYRRDFQMSDTFDPIFYTSTAEYYNHFLTLPVSAKFFFKENSSIYILGGGYASLFIDDTFKVEGRRLRNSADNIQKINAGATFGAGYRWKIDTQNELNFELRDNLGLTKGFKNTDGFKSNTIALLINYQLSL
nr:porin family protein [uncultured Flavobacterium sp.]